jgi:hypothetical protein
VIRHPDFSLLVLAATVIAVVLISVPGLHGPLLLDSTKLLGLKELVARYGDQAVLHTPGFHGRFSRIVSMTSFVLNIQLAGQVSAFQLKLTNIAIHVLSGVLVYTLSRLILGRAWRTENAAAAALGTAGLWMLAPVNVDVALYAVQRMAQLSAFFTLAGLVLYTAGRLETRAMPRVLYVASSALVCLPLALLSKENGILLLPLAFLVEVYFLHPARPWLTGRRLAAIAVLGTVAAAGLTLHLYPGVLSYQHRDFTLAERLLSEPRALMSYLRHIALPYGADIGVYGDDFGTSKSLFSPPSTLLSLLGFLAMGIFCVAGGRGRLKPLAFGVAFFLVAHAVESTFIPLEPYFLHRNYLPSYGIYLALAYLPFLALSGRAWAGRWPLIVLVIYAGYFGAISYARSLTWSSRENIVSAAVHYHPDSPRALSNYAQLAVDRGDFKLAAAAIGRSLALRDALPARLQRVYILCRAAAKIGPPEYRRLENAQTFGVSNELAQALDNVLALYRGGGCRQLNVASFVRALDELDVRYAKAGRDPWTIEYYADTFLYASGKQALALRRLQRRLEAGRLEAGLYRVELLLQEDDKLRAEATLRQITGRFPAAKLGRYARSLDDFRRRLRSM